MGVMSPSQLNYVSSQRSAAASATMTYSNSQKPDQPLKSPVSETLMKPNSVPYSKIEEKPAEKGRDRTIGIRDGDEERKEEKSECGFCLFMKAGGCKEPFVEWEKCVGESEEENDDLVEKCFQATVLLRKCMLAHSDYYSAILQAETAAELEK